MANYKTSRILPTVLVIIVIIIAIAGLVAVARALFFPGSGSDTKNQIDISQQALLTTTDDRSVSMTVRGPIVANENFRSYSIVISPSNRTIKTFTGYLDTVLEEQSLGNNTAAYSEFVNALNRANLSKGTELEGERNDVLGICATGKVVQFSIMKDGKSIETLWTSTCGGSPGSLRASVDQLAQLFRAQIPNASVIIKNAGL